MGRHGEQAAKRACLVMLVASFAACTDKTDKTDADYRADVDAAIRESITEDIGKLIQAARDLQAAAPNRAWSSSRHSDDIEAMRCAWKHMRVAYEHIEGALEATFPTVGLRLDARYEQSLTAPYATGDDYLFDGRGVIGMHAIERILYAPMIRREVTEFERLLPGYREASYPLTDDDAIAFKTGLVQQLIDDSDALRKQWRAADIDVAAAYQGLVALMIEQRDKVNLAATGADESRYSNVTLFDLRNNLEGTQRIYDLFRDWIYSKDAGVPSDSKVQHKFDRLADVYSTSGGDSLPAIPTGWSSDNPTPDDLATPFGTVWQLVQESADPLNDSSVVHVMNEIAELLGIPPRVSE
jgi:iron uptake system component EfeO